MQDADEGEVKKAYKRAALKYHPDKWANATDVGCPPSPPLLLAAPGSWGPRASWEKRDQAYERCMPLKDEKRGGKEALNGLAGGEQEEKESAEKAFKDVGEAYSVLSDPQVLGHLPPPQLLPCFRGRWE